MLFISGNLIVSGKEKRESMSTEIKCGYFVSNNQTHCDMDFCFQMEFMYYLMQNGLKQNNKNKQLHRSELYTENGSAVS